MLLNPVALAASAGLRTGSSPGLFRGCMEGAALCKALKALGEGLPCPSAESQDARSCVCLRFPGSHARSACSPLHPRLLFTDFGSLRSRRQMVPTLGRALPGEGDYHGCQAPPVSPPCVAQGAWDGSGCRPPDTPCNPSRFPQLASDPLCFKYCASRPLGGYLNPGGMPGILKRFYNIFLPSKLSWLLARAVKSSFSAVSCHLHAEGG